MNTSVFKEYKIAIITIMIIALTFIKAEAATCSSDELQNLKEEASTIEILPIINDIYEASYNNKYVVNITNLNNNFYIIDSLGNRFEHDLYYTNESLFGSYNPGTNATFKIYSSLTTNCGNELLVTKRVAFDYYNYYSRHEECKGIEEFYLCKRNYSGEIESEEWFLEQVKGYKEGKIENIDPEEKETIQEKIIKFIKDNILIVIAISAVIISIIIFICIKIKKSKNKIKINLDKSEKLIIILLFLLIISMPKVYALNSSTSSLPTSDSEASDEIAWTHGGNDSRGVRISLYKYDDKKLNFKSSVDILNTMYKVNNSCIASNKARFDLDETVVFDCRQNSNNIKLFSSFSFGNLNASLTTKDEETGKELYWGDRLDQDIKKYFASSDLTDEIKEMFNYEIEGEISDYYIIVEPTIVFENRVTGRKYYGTGFEFVNSDLSTNPIYTNSKFPISLNGSQRNAIENFLYNGLRVEKDSSMNGEYDPNAVIKDDETGLIKTTSSLTDITKIEQNKNDKSYPYGITVFWLGRLAKGCTSICSGKTGDSLLMCAENYCSNQSDITNKAQKENCITTTCGYTFDKLSCSGSKTNNASDTTCAAQTSSSKKTCQIVNTEFYSYKIECKTNSTVTYPTDLPVSLTPGLGFEYQVKLHGNKTCTVTFDEDLWKYNYASSYTDTERNNYINSINTFNQLNLNSQFYDSSNANISIKINEKINDENISKDKTLVSEEKYYKGSQAITKVATKKQISSYHNNNKANVIVNSYKTDSSNGTYYNLPSVCISSIDNITIEEKTTCDYGAGPYNKYFTDLYSETGTNKTKTSVSHYVSGMDVVNTCNYKISNNIVDDSLSCYITTETLSNKTGTIFSNDEDITFKIHVISYEKDKVLSYHLDDRIIDKTENFNGKTSYTIYKNTLSNNEDVTIYGTVTDGVNIANCKKEITVIENPSKCEFTTTKNNDQIIVKLKNINDPNAKYYMKDSTSSEWMNITTKSVKENVNITIWGRVITSTDSKDCEITLEEIPPNEPKTCTKIFEKTQIKEIREYCNLYWQEDTAGYQSSNDCYNKCSSSDEKKRTCTKLYKPTEYSNISEYCHEKWQEDTAGYSSANDCYKHCSQPSTVNTCKTLYSCSDITAIRRYCQIKYQVDGYKTVGSCINDCSCPNNGLEYYYRTITLSNPFPNRKAHNNWIGFEEYITNDVEDNTPSTNSSGPEYEIVLDSKKIQKIKNHTAKYNSEDGNNAYGDYIWADDNNSGSYKSKFIHDDEIEEGGFSTYFTYIEGTKTGG